MGDLIMDVRGTSDKEYKVLRSAMGEYIQTGEIKTPCPRCNKKLVYKQQGDTRDIVCCVDPDCVGMVQIGI